jgi:hypothetical protein
MNCFGKTSISKKCGAKNFGEKNIELYVEMSSKKSKNRHLF